MRSPQCRLQATFYHESICIQPYISRDRECLCSTLSSDLQHRDLLPRSMDLPPGPLFLFHLALRSLPTSVALYGAFRLLLLYLGVAIPAWLTILMALSAQVMFLVAMSYWRVHRNWSDAAANGAVLVPRVQDGGLSVIATMVKNVTSGYPGWCFHLRFCCLP